MNARLSCKESTRRLVVTPIHALEMKAPLAMHAAAARPMALEVIANQTGVLPGCILRPVVSSAVYIYIKGLHDPSD